VSDGAALGITERVVIPRAELQYRATRAGGPGGQHVNTSSTRVELYFNVAGSQSLDEAERARVLEKLAGRIDAEGVLRLSASEYRSQHQNKEAVTERFVLLLREALRIPKPRKKTRPTRASREARLHAKRRRSETKRLRGRVGGEE